VWDTWLKGAAGISNAWSLAAFAIAAILFVSLKASNRKVQPSGWAVICAVVLLGVIPILASTYLEKSRDAAGAIYVVRTIVLDPQGIPVSDAKMWSSVGGEPKAVSGGWEFDIPEATKPVDGRLILYASLERAFWTGKTELRLTEDHHPTATIRLEPDTSARVSGIVVDGSGKAIAGVRVSVVGYEDEVIVIKEGGNFSLPAHAAEGQIVQLHFEKKGYRAVNDDYPAGRTAIRVVLE
jgi:hypothetical protein